MADFKATINNLTGWLKSITDLGLTIILVLLILDILVPGSTNLIANIAAVVASFSANGVTGLIALLLFLMIYKR
jgi:phage-related minor tail protein